jgi:hypothetical protein
LTDAPARKSCSSFVNSAASAAGGAGGSVDAGDALGLAVGELCAKAEKGTTQKRRRTERRRVVLIGNLLSVDDHGSAASITKNVAQDRAARVVLVRAIV